MSNNKYEVKKPSGAALAARMQENESAILALEQALEAIGNDGNALAALPVINDATVELMARVEARDDFARLILRRREKIARLFDEANSVMARAQELADMLRGRADRLRADLARVESAALVVIDYAGARLSPKSETKLLGGDIYELRAKPGAVRVVVDEPGRIPPELRRASVTLNVGDWQCIVEAIAERDGLRDASMEICKRIEAADPILTAIGKLLRHGCDVGYAHMERGPTTLQVRVSGDAGDE